MSKTATDQDSTHPSTTELSAFSLGQLPLAAAEKIEQHVSQCDPCCETMLSLSGEDTFVDLLQSAKDLQAESADVQDETQHDDVTAQIPAPLASHPRYEIEHLIGRGGMGRVYKARHRMMDRSVALKVINREWVRKPEVIDRFQREVKTAASLDHRNIVTAHDAEQAGDLHFLVMEHVDGVDLSQKVSADGRLPVATACDYICQAAEGLQCAHDSGMVHRDIKPHNLMVTQDNVVKILDFGLASLAPQPTPGQPISEDAAGNLTIAGAIMGTPDFISPEQAQDAHKVDGRSDIYSLGMTLYFLLAGKAPFAEGSATDKLKQHAEAEPPRLDTIREDVPEELQNIIDRMTAKDPSERFQSPEEVADALRGIDFGGESQPPTPNGQSKDQPSPKWLGGLALALLIVAMCFLFYGREERVAQADYEAISTFLQTGEREEDPSRIVERLIRSERGREYLHQVDRENDTLAFAEGKFAREYESVVAFTHDDRLAVMGWKKDGLGQSISNIPNGFSLDSISFENKSGKDRRAFVTYRTGEQERGLLGNLKPHSNYESSILLDHLIKGPANIRDVFSEGTLVRSASSIPAAVVNPRLKLFGKTVTGDGVGIPKAHTWEFSGRDVGEMNLRLLLAQDGEAKVVQEFRLGEVPPEFTTKTRLDLKDPFGADRRRTVDATLYVDLPTGSQAYTTNEDKGVSIKIEAPFAAGVTREGLPEIAAEESELLFAKGYWTGDFSHGQSMEEMTAATKGTTATFLFVTVDWKPLDPVVAQQRREQDADEGKPAESRVIQRLLARGEHPLDRLATLICQAAGIPNDQWEDFARSPNASSQDIDGTPLSWALLSLGISHDKPEVATEFRYVNDGPPKPNAIHDAMAASKTLGYYSLLQPEHLEGLKFLVKGVEGQTARLEGDFGFELPGICTGKVSYVAEVDENADLKVTEFSLPQTGVRIRLANDGTWQRVAAGAMPENSESLVDRLKSARGDDAVAIAEAICKAAGVPNDQWRAFAKHPNASMDSIEGTPLSVVMPNEYSAIPGQRPPKPTELHGAMALSTARGYYSMLQPQYITDLAYDVAVGEDAVQLAGRIHFNGLGLYVGKVNFRADVVEKKSSDVAPTPLVIAVTEFTIPELGFSLRKDADGLWVKSEFERSNDDNFAEDYDLSQVPAQAAEVYGFSPRRMAQDATFKRVMAKLSQSRLPIGVSFNENLEQALWMKLPDGLTDSDAMIGILTVAEGTSLDFALKLSGREYATAKELAEEFGAEDGEIVWELFRDGEPTRIEGSPDSLCFQIVSEKTLLIGQSDTLAIHGKLWSQPRDEDFLAASTRLNKVDHQVFALAKSMDQSHLSKVVESSAMPAFRDFVFQHLPIFTDSSYIAVTLSLNEDPRLEVLSTLAAADQQASVTSVMKNLVTSVGKLANALPTERSRIDKGGAMHLTPAAKSALTAALSDAKVTEPSTTESRLTISLFDVEPQLRPYIEEFLNAVNSRRRLYDVASRNNLRQLAISFHLFADVHGYFPSVKTMLPDAKHPVSWRVAILPFIGEEKLFEQYNLDEPWDSENNRKLADRTPRVFRHPSQSQDVGCTNYVVVAGADTATGDGSKPIKLDDITDGSSQTILLAESLARIPWTKPEDPIFDSSNSLPELGGMFKTGFQVALVDGAVQPIPASISDEMLKALITRNGGERIPAEVFQANAAGENHGELKESIAEPSMNKAHSGPTTSGSALSLDEAREAIVGLWRPTQMISKGYGLPSEIVEAVKYEFTEDRYRLSLPIPSRGVHEKYEDEPYSLTLVNRRHSIAIGEGSDRYQGLVEFEGRDTLRLYLPIDLDAALTEAVLDDKTAYTLDILKRVEDDNVANEKLPPKSESEPLQNVDISISFKKPTPHGYASVVTKIPLDANEVATVWKLMDLASHLNEIDWRDTNSEAVVVVHQKGSSLSDSLRIEGVLNAGPDDRPLVASWRAGDGNVLHRQRESQPLKNVNDAFSLVYSFFMNDGRLDSLTTWNEVEPSPLAIENLPVLLWSPEEAEKVIVGAWRPTKMIREGRELPQEIVDSVRFDFTRDRYSLSLPQTSAGDQAPYEDKQYELTRRGELYAIRIGNGDSTYEGLVEFVDRDTLRLCLPLGEAAPPTEIVTRDGAPYTVDVLKRLSDTPEEPGNVEAPSGASADSAISILTRSRDGSEKVEYAARANDTSSEWSFLEIDRDLNEIDWADTKNGATVLVHSKENLQKDSLRIEGVLNARSGKRPLLATWREGNAKVLHRQRQSQPLKNVNEAFSLIYSFYMNDGRLESLTKWKDIRPSKLGLPRSKPEPSEEAHNGNDAAMTLPDGKRIEKSFTTFSDREDTSGSTSTIISELESLERLWSALNWKNRNGRYAVGIQLHGLQHDSMMIYGVPNAKDGEQPLVAVWREGDGKKLTRQRQSGPLSGLGEAFKLLTTFDETHGGLEADAEWYDVEPHLLRL